MANAFWNEGDGSGTAARAASLAAPSLPAGVQDLPPHAALFQQLGQPAGGMAVCLRSLWQEELGLDRIGEHDNFFLVGGTWPRALGILERFQRLTGRELPASVFAGWPTIAQLSAWLEGRLAAHGAPSLVLMRDGVGMPVFVVHGASGTLAESWPIVSQMRCGRPLWGLQAATAESASAASGSIEAMAAAHVARIRRVQAAGPYAVCGMGAGGAIALEIARELQLAREPMELVCLLGTSLPPTRTWRERIPHMLATGARAMLHDTHAPPPDGPRDAAAGPARARAIANVIEAAADAYRPRPYEGEAVVLICPETPLPGHADPPRIWRRVARRHLDVIRIAGTHEDLMLHHTSLLAMHLDVLLTPFLAEGPAATGRVLGVQAHAAA